MADNIQYITINDTITAQGQTNTSTIMGTLGVDYTTNMITGTLTAQNPNGDMATFSPKSLQMSPPGSRGMYLITVGADGPNPAMNSLTIYYDGQTPSTVDVAYSLNGVSYGYSTETVMSSPTPPVCFVQGTLIRTTRGDVRVEDLNVGDGCITSSGALRPIQWLGQQAISFTDTNSNDMPVLVRAGAFGRGLPFADLYLSPGHSVCVDILGEVLVPISSLINGTTVVQQDVASTVYWHVELEDHNVVLANGLPSESYIDCGNRGFFAGETNKPDGFATTTDYCRPFVVDGLLVDALRMQLETRAVEMGWSIGCRPLDVHLMVGGRSFSPTLTRRDGMTIASFAVPRDAAGGWSLMSTTYVPMHFNAGDKRRLGLRVCGIEIGGEKIELDRLDLEGFGPIESDGEAAWRWTGKSAHLPQEARNWASSGAVTLELFLLNHDMPVWNAPQTAAEKRPKLSLVA